MPEKQRQAYQVRHAFAYEDAEGNRTYFTRANEHKMEEVIGADGLEPYIATGSVVRVNVPDDYRAPGEPAEPSGKEQELPEEPVFTTVAQTPEEALEKPARKGGRKR